MAAIGKPEGCGRTPADQQQAVQERGHEKEGKGVHPTKKSKSLSWGEGRQTIQTTYHDRDWCREKLVPLEKRVGHCKERRELSETCPERG